ncbi:MAG: hypothetical protein NTY44_11595 [Deltaproteobacteria bacterium]|nr:hypothetical protein [Deltaproteobacteria bacterium]
MVKKKEEEMVACPVGKFFMDLQKLSRTRSKFFEHMDLSRIEFLKAIRSLVDERIEGLEEKKRSKQGKKATKIEVT